MSLLVVSIIKDVMQCTKFLPKRQYKEALLPTAHQTSPPDIAQITSQMGKEVLDEMVVGVQVIPVRIS